MDELKQKRQTLKGSITRIFSYCQNASNSIDDIKVRVEKLESIFREYENVQSNIDTLTSLDNMAVEENYRSEIEDKYFAIKAILSVRTREEQLDTTVVDVQNQTEQGGSVSSAIHALIDHQNTLGTLVERLATPCSDGNAASSTVHTNTIQQEVRLPRIQIPEFDGTYINWIHFRDLFEVMVHTKSSLANIEKFEYLLTKLKGEALSIVRHLKPTNENYTVAWELLHKKYNEGDKVKKAYVGLLLDQQSIKAPTLSEIRRLYNDSNESMNALRALGESVDQWDTLLLYLFEKKLDPETAMLWYRSRSAEKESKFAQLMTFLEQRVTELENIQSINLNKGSVKSLTSSSNVNRQPQTSKIYVSQVKQCPVCTGNHLVYQCEQFKGKSVEERIQIVRDVGLCFNCLRDNHRAFNCTSSLCKMCNKKHNSLLHVAQNNSNEINYPQRQMESVSINVSNVQNEYVTLLPTAIIKVLDINNQYQSCRVLIDSGAQVSIIREACMQRLGLKRRFNNTTIHGIGRGGNSRCKGEVKLCISSHNVNHKIETSALCLSDLTQNLPGRKVQNEKLDYFRHLELADKNYDTPNGIDIILGAEMFAECMLSGKLVHPSGSPSAVETIFGWVILGRIESSQSYHIFVGAASLDPTIQLQKFWEVEEIQPMTQLLTVEEQQAEDHYVRHVARATDGRYIVRLPVKEEKFEFGESKLAALNRLYLMEKRFQKDEILAHDYKQFMHEYMTMSHMEEVVDANTQSENYLPHHAVFKPDSTTTKLRVVFDASCKSSNGKSLNDQLLIGTTVQKDLFSLLVQFRIFEIGLTGDIEKMYRQILVNKKDRCYQRVLWRESNEDEVKAYDLKTVTYGTACAPFLATRTLKQIGIENSLVFPEASRAIVDCFYVDDFMCCSEDVESAVKLKNEVCKLLTEAGFHLRKWCSNSSEFMSTIDANDKEMSSETIIDDTQTVKTLGLLWDTTCDSFKYKVALSELQPQFTKRTVLSDISKIFDPLGWLAPVVISMKLLMQQLWLKGIEWNEPLPNDVVTRWDELRSGINDISNIKIPRWIKYTKGDSLELHCFADASEVAYAAAVYVKVRHVDGLVSTNLLAAKSRVAPIKQITLPRLELCAAQLMTKLVVKVKETLDVEQLPIFGYSDSTIVLAWLSDYPRRWKTFIANRTSYILNVLPRENWRHISSHQNPADLATRGITACNLINSDLWWHGPDILKTHNHWEEVAPEPPDGTHLEERQVVIYHVSKNPTDDLFARFSSFERLLSVTAYMLRFISNCRTSKVNRVTGILSVQEIRNAHDVLIRKAQKESFNSEIQILLAGKVLPVKHGLSALTPFIDPKQLLRVGGRIENANISFDQKHPIILKNDNLLTHLIVRYYHNKYLHASNRQLQYVLGLKYWIPGVIRLVKQCIYKCTTCMRFRNKPFCQQMSNLPQYRLEPTLAFVNTGIDFAGPIHVKSWKGRGSKTYKCWIAVFVCLVTKAIHLELVSELSTASFLATLRRFVARRGKPSDIYSDNGTNFVGCNQQLKELWHFLHERHNQEKIVKGMAEQQIQWHFIPPTGPHFGGMWEAGVKSTKYHLKRVLGDANTTFEETYTVLCQIECCLNSRPLCIKFEGDTDPLTPGHFLILRSMATVPDLDYTNSKVNILNRWQYLQKLVQQFWKKWSLEYINQLRQRPKWSQKLKNIECGDIVLLKDDTLPPSKWNIGRVVETHPGKDELVRVVSVKTSRGIFKRPIVKLCPLFMDF